MPAIRKCLSVVDRSRASHAGLLLRRFLHVAVGVEKEDHPSERAALHRAALQAMDRTKQLYEQTFNRWKTGLPAGTIHEPLCTLGRMIVGLGGDSVTETGINLQHTYGVPLIPGSALKGLAAHYCDQVWGARLESDPHKLTAENHKFRRLRADEKRGANGVHPETGSFHVALFGTTDDSGHIIFHDAWIMPDSLDSASHSGLVLDVMTPHHGDYYSGKEYEAGSNRGKLIPPTDFDDPNPVTFLSVSGRFLVAVSCDVPGPTGDAWAGLAFAVLKEALLHWGVGGKTSSGYGRLVVPPPPPLPSPPKKRQSGTPAKVRIIAPRPKGGFDVQDLEAGRPQGVLTVGTPPTGADPGIGVVVDVNVHNDDPGKPQYRWPTPKKT